MKRFFELSLLLLFVCLVTGCGKKDVLMDVNGVEKSDFTINETAVINDVHYTVTDFEFTNEKFTLPNGHEIEFEEGNDTYLIIKLRIDNKSDDSIPLNFEPLLDIKNKTIEGDYKFLVDPEEMLGVHYLDVDKSVTYIYYYELNGMPKDTSFQVIVGEDKAQQSIIMNVDLKK